MTEEKEKQVQEHDKTAQLILDKLFAYVWEDNKEEIREAYEHFLFYGEWPENFLQADKL